MRTAPFDLLHAIRSTIRADSDPSRQALFATLTRSRASAGAARRVHAWLGTSWLSTAFVSLYGLRAFLSVHAPRREPFLLTIAVHANAARQVDRVAGWFPDRDCARVASGSRGVARPAIVARLMSLVLSGSRVWRALRIIHRVNGRYDFLVTCRTAACVAWYARGDSILRRNRPHVVVVSSDTNPEEVAFTAAARARRVPTVFIAHSFPTPNSPPLVFDLSLLEGEAALAARRRRGRVAGDVYLLGLEGPSSPMQPERLAVASPVIGIFTPKAVSWSCLAEVIEGCRSRIGAREIVIRWHPSMLEPPRLDHVVPDPSGLSISAPSDTLDEVAARCSWIIADLNSNVHLPVLRLGIPTIAIAGLGGHRDTNEDVCGFLANGVVYPPVDSIASLSLEDAATFYGPGYETRLARYDAAYLRDAAGLEAGARGAIERLARSRTPAGGSHEA